MNLMHVPFFMRTMSAESAGFLRRSGFTLIELLVTTGIVVLVMTILISNYSQYGSRTELENLTHTLALAIRQGQVYGIAIKETFPGSGVYPPYGVSIEIPAGLSPQITSFRLFADTSTSGANAGVYDSADAPQSVTVYNLTHGYYIGAVRGCTAGGSCTTFTGPANATVLFPRPDLLAVFNIVPLPLGSGVSAPFCSSQTTPCTYSYIEIELRSGAVSSISRQVQAWVSGQVTIK